MQFLHSPFAAHYGMYRLSIVPPCQSPTASKNQITNNNQCKRYVENWLLIEHIIEERAFFWCGLCTGNDIQNAT